MSNPTLNDIKLHMIKVREASVRTGDWVCCLNCENWGEWQVDPYHTQKLCTKWGKLPPQEVIVVGCAEHTPAIPF